MKKRKGLTFIKKEKKIKPHHFTWVFVLLFWMAAVSFIAFVLVLIFGTRSVVIGDSMNPLLYNSEVVLINKSSFLILKPQVNDIIAFYPNGNTKSHFYIKRVVAVPGDKVLIQNGRLYVNDELFEFEGLYEPMEYAGMAENEIVLEKDEFFVLGDNRKESEDSRYGNIGPVKRDDIIGRVWFHFKYGDEKAGLVK
ncbi:MAG: signal peptidase I [Lachnospiraceae bacterium]|nr:signal peptidase I [Lachnospiraceae bacterium]